MRTLTALSLAAACAFPAAATNDVLVESNVAVASATRYALRDLGGSPAKEFVSIGPLGIAVFEFDEAGALSSTAAFRMPWPAHDLAWDLTDVDNDGVFELLALLDGAALHIYSWNGDKLVDQGVSLETQDTYLPPGIRHIRMARDVDDDGTLDIVLPSIDRYLIHIATAPRAWQPPLGVRFSPDISIDVGDPSSLDDEFGQSVRIPWFRLRDIDGDGKADLVSETDDDVTFYIADDKLPSQPTWVLDLAALKDTSSVRERLDLDNLLAMLGDQVKWRVADIDGTGAWDLLIQQGGTTRLYLDGSRGADISAPDQVLKASGNVLYAMTRDVDGDGRDDLQIVRTDDLSAARVIRWLVFAGSLDLDLFTYRNEGRGFARKPSHRSTLRLQIPAILTALDEFEDVDDRMESRTDVPTRAMAFDSDGVFDDIVDVREGRVLVFRNLVDGDASRLGTDTAVKSVDDLESIIEEVLLNDLDALEDGGVKTIDLLETDSLVTSVGWELRQRTLGRTAYASIALTAGNRITHIDREAVIRIDDIDRDGRSDIIITGESSDGDERIRMLLNRNDG